MSEKSQMQTDALHENLERGLKERHIQLIGLGGAIGVGLFLGSASAIEKAGPAVMLAYLLGGIAIFFVMRAMGELTIEYPVSGSFSAHANKFLSPLMGYITGWTYWYFWIVTCMCEVTAVGIYIHFWMPDMPQWLSALVALAAMACVNVIAVKAYGEFEFWFALIKVATIIFLIVTGLGMIIFGLGNGGIAIGFSNLWSIGGFMPHGLSGVCSTILMVMFAYGGIEVIGVTAGEASNPVKTLSAAIDKVLYRIMLFYVFALLVIMSIYPWNEIGHAGSPFVMTFEKLGIGGAANIINFVVITAALSACNSGIYSTGRMLYNLSLQGKAPKAFNTVNEKKVPVRAIQFSLLMMLIGVVLNYFVPASVFDIISGVSAFASIVTWIIILVCQLQFRKGLNTEAVEKLKYKMPLCPYANYAILFFFAVVLISAAFDANTRLAVFATIVWLGGLTGAYYLVGLHKTEKVENAALQKKAE